jgi:hypothetical protein
MSIAQVNGQPVVSGSTNNNNGVAINIGQSTKLSSISLSGADTPATTVINNGFVDPILNAGTFVYNNKRPIAKKTTSSLANVVNNYLLSGALKPGLITSINKLETTRTEQLSSAIRQNKYNLYDNTFAMSYPVLSFDNFGEDSAARMTDTFKGKLTFNIGNPIPINQNYKMVVEQQQQETFRLLTENNSVLNTESNQPLVIEE